MRDKGFFSRLFEKRVVVSSPQPDCPEITMLDACTTALEEVGDEAELFLLIVQKKDGCFTYYSNKLHRVTKLGMVEALRHHLVSGYTEKGDN